MRERAKGLRQYKEAAMKTGIATDMATVGQATRAVLLGAGALYAASHASGKEAEACYVCQSTLEYAWCSWMPGISGAIGCWPDGVGGGCVLQGSCMS